MSRFFTRLHQLLWTHPALAIGAMALFSVLSVFFARRLTFSSDIIHILPESSPAVDGVNQLVKHFSFTGQLFIYLEKTSPDASDEAGFRYVDSIAASMQASPEVTRVDSRVTKEAEAFIGKLVESHGPLLLQDEEFERFLARLEPEEIRKRVKRNRRRLASPGIGAADLLVQRDPLDLWLDFYIPVAKAALPPGKMDSNSGYFQSVDHGSLFLIVEGKQAPHDVEFCRRIVRDADAAIARGRAEIPGADRWRVTLLGGYPIALANEAAIRSDMKLTILSSIPPVLLMLIISLRRWSALVVGFLALHLGILWTFGLAGVTYGHLTGVTVGFAGLLAGMGIDFTIHLVNRYRHERAGGMDPAAASEETFRGAGSGVFIAMATSVASLLCLLVSQFKGLREFATLVGLGLFLVFAATVMVWPVLKRLASRPNRSDDDISAWAIAAAWVLFLGYNAWGIWQMPVLGVVTLAACLLFMTDTGEKIVTHGIVHRPWIGAGLGLAATAVAVVAVLPEPTGLPIRETDVKNLRNEGDTILDVQERMRVAYQSGLDPLLVISRAGSEEELLENLSRIERSLSAGKHGAPADDPIAHITVQSLTDFVPPPSRQKRHAEALAKVDVDRVLRDLDLALDAEGFDPAAFEGARTWLRTMLSARSALLPSQVNDPFFASVRSRFLSRPGADGLQRALTWVTPQDPLHVRESRERAINSLDRLSRQGDPGAVLSGFNVVVKELDDRIGPDIFLATMAAMALTCFLAALLFMNPFWALLALLPGAVGTLWLVGCLRLFDLHMNYLNLIVFPLMMGMGTDNGLHLVARFRELGGRDAVRTLGSLWRGITLTSLTTIVGFGSLAFAANRAMKSLGLAISIGMLCYLVSSLLVLPPILVWMERRRNRVG